MTATAPEGIGALARAALAMGAVALAGPWVGLGLDRAGSGAAYGVLFLAAPLLALGAVAVGLVGAFTRRRDRQTRAAAASGATLGVLALIQWLVWVLELINHLE